MDKIKELRAKAEELIAKMRALLDLADTEKRDLTQEETDQYAGFEAEADKLERDIDRLEKLEERAARAEDAGDKPYKVKFKRKLDVPKEFRNIGEFIHAVRFNHDDPRLQDCEYRELETRDQSMGVGTEGGFALPTQFRPQLLQVTPAEAIFQPRAQVIPPGDPPDASVTMPALDQTSAQNVYGGVVMYKIAEASALTQSNIALKEVTLEPQGIGGYIQVSNKLLLNWQAASALLERQLRLALAGYKDTQFYSGNGVAGPLGVLNSPARIDVARTTANQIARGDVNNMIARAKQGGSYLWIASQTILPQLLALADGASGLVFQMDYTKPIPASLLGIPLMFHDRSVALGTKGDLILVDLNYYLIKEGSGPFVDASPHVRFLNNQTVIKITQNIDGKPWLSAPLPLEGSTSNTVSPFVVLN